MTAIKLYNELAQWWPIFSAKEDYADEAACFRDIFLAAVMPPPKTLVELGSGGGNNAFYLKRDFAMTLVDASPGMVEASRTINPECEHLVGDMRTVRLERVFDAVFIHDAIMYITTEGDLRRTIETAYMHVKPGGVALLAPDFVRETFKTETEDGGHDGEGRSMRWLSWSFPPDPGGSTFDTHFVYMLKDGNHLTVEHDLHTCGLFAREVWLRLLEQAGFQTRIVVDNYNRDLFVALKL
jgi:cyclopropane fatty-acyl-phospholipid synthase-like methyltransferase